MLQSVSFGNKFVNEATIFAKEEVAKATEQAAKVLSKQSKSESVEKCYKSPFASTTIPSQNSGISAAEASFAISHGNPVGKNLDVKA